MHVHQSHFSLKANAATYNHVDIAVHSWSPVISHCKPLWQHYNICRYLLRHVCPVFKECICPSYFFFFLYTLKYLGRSKKYASKILNRYLQYPSGTVGEKISKVPHREKTETTEQVKIFIEAWLPFCRQCRMTPEEELKNTLPPFCVLFDRCRLLRSELLLICMHHKLWKNTFPLQPKSSQFYLYEDSMPGK